MGEGGKKKRNRLNWVPASSVTSRGQLMPFKVDKSSNRTIFNTSKVNAKKDNFIY